MARDEKLSHLARVPLFAHLKGKELKRVGQLADEIAVDTGKTLARKGRIGHEFFIVLDGSVKVTNGRKLIGTLGPGGFFGEISLVDGRPRVATVTAAEPTRLVVIAHREFHALMDEFPKVRAAVLDAVVERLRGLEEAAGTSS